MQMVIDLKGNIHCLYREEMDLAKLGEVSIQRASHVEPEGNCWYADLSPVKGPRLGPFPLRSQALEAEVIWLQQHLADLSR